MIAERVNKRLVTHVLERTFSPVGGMALLRRVSLKNWPPRYSDTTPASEQEAVTESEVPADSGNPAAPVSAARKTRVRSLLKPAVPKRRRTTPSPHTV